MGTCLSKPARLKVLTPPPPSILLSLSPAEADRYFPERPPTDDNPLASLYRIYWTIMTANTIPMRSEIEYFWSRKDRAWAVESIPDPKDPDPERYAVVAASTYLLTTAFNNLIDRGLPRDAPGIMTDEQEAKQRLRKHVREKVPSWAEAVPPLPDPLFVPMLDGRAPRDAGAEGVDGFMARKNVLTYTLHIYFV